MKLWEQLEQHLTAANMVGQSFNCAALAQDLGITNKRATLMIQGHLKAQRSATLKPRFVLYRTGLTSAAMWHVGDTPADARKVGRQYLNDMSARMIRGLQPDLVRIGFNNPTAKNVCDAIVGAVEANLYLLGTGL